ncbi:MAG: ABC transporter permease [Butyricicoccaceae bacterium]
MAYLTGFSEQDMTPAQVVFYEDALHLNKPLATQFGFYLRSLLDGTLGYSYKKDAAVSALVGEKIGYTLQITVPAVLLSAGIGLLWGLRCGYKKDSLTDRFSTTALIILNAVPTFLIGLGLMIVFCFQNRWLPYTGLNSPEAVRGTAGHVWDRVLHLLLPVGTLTLAALPSRYLLVRNMAVSASDGKDILYAKQRGLPDSVIRRDYLLRSIAQAVSHDARHERVALRRRLGRDRKIFSIGGMDSLLTEAVYTLDEPLMQGILFVTTCIMVLSILLTDFLCLLLDPKRRLEGKG